MQQCQNQVGYLPLFVTIKTWLNSALFPPSVAIAQISDDLEGPASGKYSLMWVLVSHMTLNDSTNLPETKKPQ